MTKKQRLELTWIGKENRPRLEPRIIPDSTVMTNMSFENLVCRYEMKD